MHIDLDAFFAAVEQRVHPQWRGLPLVVGAEPGRRGVVASCSYEARRYGVHSAMPISEAVHRLPPETVYVRPDFECYAQTSRQIMSALKAIAPIVEKVSVDEAYLDISGLERLVGPPVTIDRQAKAAIREAVARTASVGIGPNRLIAKLASDYRKPDGLTVVPRDRVHDFLDPMPLAVLRGVGAKTAQRLEQMGAATISDVRHLLLDDLRRHLGAKMGSQVHLQSHGIADDQVYPATERKSILKETTFAEDVTDPVVLRDTLRWAAQEVCYQARHENRKGLLITLKIRFAPFQTQTRSRTLSVPSASEVGIFQAAWAALRDRILERQTRTSDRSESLRLGSRHGPTTRPLQRRGAATAAGQGSSGQDARRHSGQVRPKMHSTGPDSTASSFTRPRLKPCLPAVTIETIRSSWSRAWRSMPFKHFAVS